jgi:hypothetical protein
MAGERITVRPSPAEYLGNAAGEGPGFDLRHSGGKLPGPIGQPAALCGRLSELLGRVLMLRASRREDRKRVPQYSSS